MFRTREGGAVMVFPGSFRSKDDIRTAASAFRKGIPIHGFQGRTFGDLGERFIEAEGRVLLDPQGSPEGILVSDPRGFSLEPPS